MPWPDTSLEVTRAALFYWHSGTGDPVQDPASRNRTPPSSSRNHRIFVPTDARGTVLLGPSAPEPAAGGFLGLLLAPVGIRPPRARAVIDLAPPPTEPPPVEPVRGPNQRRGLGAPGRGW